MKRQYQIEQQRAVQQFRRIATEQNPNIQMILPLAEIVGLLQQGVGNLLREAGLALMQTVMEEEVRHLAGERHQQHEGRRAHRWGKEDGYCVVDGQKVPIRKTRLRGGTRIGLRDTAAVCPGWRQSTGCCGAETCRRGGLHPALPGAQEAQRRGSFAGRT